MPLDLLGAFVYVKLSAYAVPKGLDRTGLSIVAYGYLWKSPIPNDFSLSKENWRFLECP